MTPEEIISLFEKYGYLESSGSSSEDLLELVDEEMEPPVMALEMLSEVAGDRSIFYSLGDNCEADELIEDFSNNIEEIIEISGGKIEIANLQLRPPLNAKGDADDSEEMNISFTWDNNEYSWTFTRYENDEFVKGFTKWVHEALKGDFMFIYDDHPFGYHISEELIRDLENIGVETHLDMCG